ncbi:MAG: hypothetical protein LQ342_003187 [Letrouitia transgressa]|nr:MAG: hypothetical protein LQ342_003187 [Letrouitia transgressa]
MCYFRAGQQIRNVTPCYPDAEYSMCCNREDICLTNGLCYIASANRLHRGACTDPTFSSPSCSQICPSPADEAPLGYADVLPCPNSSKPTLWYCGLGNSDRCDPGPSQKTFTLPSGFLVESKSTNAVAAPTATVTGTPAAVNSSSSTAGKQCAERKGVEAGIGVGVGVPLAAALAGAVWLLFKEKKRGQDRLAEQQRGFLQQQLELDKRRFQRNALGAHELATWQPVYEAPT